MRKLVAIFLLITSLLLLTSCNISKDIHSVQFGKVNLKGDIIVEKTYRNEETYQKIQKIIDDAINVNEHKIDINHLGQDYIQLTNERQNMVISNYYLWEDTKNKRYICKAYYDEDQYYYEIIGHDYLALKRYISKVIASKEKLPTSDKKAEEQEQVNDGEE